MYLYLLIFDILAQFYSITSKIPKTVNNAV